MVHGDPADVREGDFSGDVIVIEFPDRDHAVGWYESRAYPKTVELRTANTTGWVVLIDGVPTAHRATDVLDGRPVEPPGSESVSEASVEGGSNLLEVPRHR